jgi:hypothetical protein
MKFATAANIFHRHIVHELNAFNIYFYQALL